MSIDILKNLIREEVKRALKEAPESTPTLVVKNLAQANLWACEIVGQLSDGAWENTKPWDYSFSIRACGHVFLPKKLPKI
jgi:hypothetical protein